MANVDYSDYQGVLEMKKEIAAYYQIAVALKKELTGAQTETQLACERLRKMSYNVGINSKTWAGQDAESYAQTARDICSELEAAEALYIKGLDELIEYFDKENERLTEFAQKAVKEMGILSKGIYYGKGLFGMSHNK